MTRFTTAAIEIPDLNPEVQFHALKNGLRLGKFQEAIAIVKPKTLEEFREKATGDIEIEELCEARKNEKPPSRKEEEKPHRSQNKDSKKSFKLTPKFDSYARFNTKREDIIKEILHNKLIKPPSKVGTYQDQKYVDRSKHCAFNHKFGHTTDECVVAKDLLERLARQGLLDKYVTSKTQKKPTRNTDRLSYSSDHKEKGAWQGHVETPAPKEVINYISGGFAGGGTTTSARKRSYRAMMTMEGSRPDYHVSVPTPQIAFSNADLKSPCPNFDDPVVISV
ncbi:uncharacterized protein LOC130981447 [Arachis stenosperma]|uniref:uncharacterized protein LOC130981447 n=1 Tax=Arachis stenosperma TaxID=217475 RepID=UPI0025AC2D09|nr:uncharacterized protein LOC130981447 [Arachis stenosperma]